MKKSWICLFMLAGLLLFPSATLGMRNVFAQPVSSIYLPLAFRADGCRNEIPDQPASSVSMEAETLRQINIQRANNGGLAPLRMNDTLVQVARFHSLDMANNDFFDHFGSAGESPWERYDWMCEKFGRKGEIIAGGHTSARAVVAAWMDSPDHRRIILTAEFTLAGVGYTLKNGSEWGTYWTVNFATPGSAASVSLPPGAPADSIGSVAASPQGVIGAAICP